MRGSDPRRPIIRALSLIPVGLVATLPVVTAMLVWLGPAPSRPDAASGFSAEAIELSYSEPTDRLVFVAWLIATVLVVGLALRLGRRTSISPWWGLAATPGALLVGIAFLYADDPIRLTPAIDLTTLSVGAVLAVSLTWAAGRRWAGGRPLNVLLIVVALVVYVPVWLQLPGELPDAGNAYIVISELAAPGAGLLPLHDFFPQYTHLLGLPIAWLLAALPAHTVGIALGWVLLLQLVAVGMAVWVVTQAFGWWMLGPAAVLVPSLAFVAADGLELTAFTYFGVNPARTVLPVCAVAVAVWAFRARTYSWAGLVAAGFVSGLAALNNPDFGLPALAAVWGAGVYAAAPGRERVRALLVIPAAAASAFGLFALVAFLIGRPLSLTAWLLFPNIFGGIGFNNLPMSAIGWHVGAVVLFGAAAGCGFALLRMDAAGARARRRVQGLTLLLVGSWSLLTLPYFVGRSAPSTLLGGYALQAGWSIACLFPLIILALRAARDRTALTGWSVWAASALGVAALAVIAGLATNVVRVDVAERKESVRDVAEQSMALRRALQAAPAPLRTAAREGRVTQILSSPTITALDSGVPSEGTFTSPDYFKLSTALIWRQCQRLAGNRAERYVIMSPATLRLLGTVPACREVLRLGRATPLSVPGEQQLRFLAVPAH